MRIRELTIAFHRQCRWAFVLRLQGLRHSITTRDKWFVSGLDSLAMLAFMLRKKNQHGATSGQHSNTYVEEGATSHRLQWKTSCGGSARDVGYYLIFNTHKQKCIRIRFATVQALSHILGFLRYPLIRKQPPKTTTILKTSPVQIIVSPFGLLMALVYSLDLQSHNGSHARSRQGHLYVPNEVGKICEYLTSFP